MEGYHTCTVVVLRCCGSTGTMTAEGEHRAGIQEGVMTIDNDRTGIRRLRSLPELLTAVVFVCGTLSASPAMGDPATDAPRRQFRPWMFTLGVGILVHTGITESGCGDSQSDFAAEVGIGHVLGSHFVSELSATVSTPRDDFGTWSLLVVRGQLRVYPTLDRRQTDQLFLVLGAELAVGEHPRCGRRFAGGPEIGLGMDFFVGRTTSVFLQVSLAITPVSDGTPPDDDRLLPESITCSSSSCALFPAMVRMTAGTRFGL